MKKIRSKAFTLIELLVVITIIGILSTIVTATFRNNIQKTNDVKRLSNMQNILDIIRRDSIETRNGEEMFVYDSDEIETTLKKLNYEAETSGKDLCYFIGIAKGASGAGHDNEIAIASWGDASSTINGSQEGLLVVGTEQAVFNLSHTPINGDPVTTLLRDDFLCDYPERLIKVQNAFAGRPLNYSG